MWKSFQRHNKKIFLDDMRRRSKGAGAFQLLARATRPPCIFNFFSLFMSRSNFFKTDLIITKKALRKDQKTRLKLILIF